MIGRRGIGALMAISVVAFQGLTGVGVSAPKGPPKTGFEERNGESWTTQEEEVEFLTAVDEMSDRVDV
ncbi:MAG: carboxypeptidase, partial [Actinomycetota bacterium]